MCGMLLLQSCLLWSIFSPTPIIHLNSNWEVAPQYKNTKDGRLNQLGELTHRLGQEKIVLAGSKITKGLLEKIYVEGTSRPLTQVTREQIKRPINLIGFLKLLDDIVVAKETGVPLPPKIHLSSRRARKMGVLMAPREIFRGIPVVYPNGYASLDLSPHIATPSNETTEPKDSPYLGAGWTQKYPQPRGEKQKMKALEKLTDDDFHRRVESLINQLRKQQVKVYLGATVRSQERGYLIWGSYLLSTAQSRIEYRKAVRKLTRYKKRWKLKIPIRWYHPRGWETSRDLALEMVETYQTAFATRAAAEKSKHYEGRAIDMTTFHLPRKLLLESPCGVLGHFDLSASHQTRDLNLTPEVIDWIEKHFGMKKLRSDYPHWEDEEKPFACIKDKLPTEIAMK